MFGFIVSVVLGRFRDVVDVFVSLWTKPMMGLRHYTCRIMPHKHAARLGKSHQTGIPACDSENLLNVSAWISL